jgi:hypothetical protein
MTPPQLLQGNTLRLHPLTSARRPRRYPSRCKASPPDGTFFKICQNSSFLVFLTTRSRNITTSQRILFNFLPFFLFFAKLKRRSKKIPKPTALRSG